MRRRLNTSIERGALFIYLMDRRKKRELGFGSWDLDMVNR